MDSYELAVAFGALLLGAAAVIYANWSVRNLERQLAKQPRR